MKFLDISGLTQVWDAIKTKFIPRSGGELELNASLNFTSDFHNSTMLYGTWTDSTYYMAYETNVDHDEFRITELSYANSSMDDLLMTRQISLAPSSFGVSEYNYSNDENKDITINVNGITIANKTENDLLNAAGGTISIDELKAQIGGGTSGNYLPLSGGSLIGPVYTNNQIQWRTSDTANVTITAGQNNGINVTNSDLSTTITNNKIEITKPSINHKFTFDTSMTFGLALMGWNESGATIQLDTNNGVTVANNDITVQGGEIQLSYNSEYASIKTTADGLGFETKGEEDDTVNRLVPTGLYLHPNAGVMSTGSENIADNIFWNTNGGKTAMEALTEEEILQILV